MSTRLGTAVLVRRGAAVVGSRMDIAKTLRENLRLIVSAYRKATRKSLEAVSREFYGKTPFLRAYFAGEGKISTEKYGDVYAMFLEKWPEQADWPFLRSIVFDRPDRKMGTAAPKALAGEGASHISPPD